MQDLKLIFFMVEFCESPMGSQDSTCLDSFLLHCHRHVLDKKLEGPLSQLFPWGGELRKSWKKRRAPCQVFLLTPQVEQAQANLHVLNGVICPSFHLSHVYGCLSDGGRGKPNFWGALVTILTPSVAGWVFYWINWWFAVQVDGMKKYSFQILWTGKGSCTGTNTTYDLEARLMGMKQIDILQVHTPAEKPQDELHVPQGTEGTLTHCQKSSLYIANCNCQDGLLLLLDKVTGWSL